MIRRGARWERGWAEAAGGGGASPRFRQPRPRVGLTLLFGMAAVAVVAASAVAFLNTVQAGTIAISPLSGLLGAGVTADVTAVDSSVTITNGRAQDISGIELYRIELTNSALSGHLVVSFDWLNPQDAHRVLNNPNGWIDVGLYENSGTTPTNGACPTGQYYLNDTTATGSALCVSADASPESSAVLTAATADAELLSATSGQQYVYVLGAIHTPGHVPPGEQSGLETLQYQLHVVTH